MLESVAFQLPMAHDVFISYSAKDKPTADAVCAKLEARGVRCWIAPRDILPSEEYAAALVNALRGSRLMVLIFSSGANQSQQVLREVERAVSRGLPILPLRIEDVAPSEAMEYYIASRHWLDALTPPLENHLAHLTETVTLLLSRPPEVSTHPAFQPEMDAVPMSPIPSAREFPQTSNSEAVPVPLPPPVRPAAENVAPPAAVTRPAPVVVAAPTAAPVMAATVASPAPANVQLKKPMIAFILNFLVAGAGFAYLGKWKWAAVNLVAVIAVGIFFANAASDSLTVVSIAIAALDGGIAKTFAEKMNAKINLQGAAVPQPR